MFKLKHYIGGEWQADCSTVANINPSDISETSGNFAQASADQVQQAISAAACSSAEWGKSRLNVSKQYFKQSVMSWLRCDELGTLLSREEGKPLKVVAKVPYGVSSSNTSRKYFVKLATAQNQYAQARFCREWLVKRWVLSASSLLGDFPTATAAENRSSACFQ